LAIPAKYFARVRIARKRVSAARAGGLRTTGGPRDRPVHGSNEPHRATAGQRRLPAADGEFACALHAALLLRRDQGREAATGGGGFGGD